MKKIAKKEKNLFKKLLKIPKWVYLCFMYPPGYFLSHVFLSIVFLSPSWQSKATLLAAKGPAPAKIFQTVRDSHVLIKRFNPSAIRNLPPSSAVLIKKNQPINTSQKCIYIQGENDPATKAMWTRHPASVRLAKSWQKAAVYFKNRILPAHRFIDMGVALHPLLFPLKTHSEPFSLYLNYRREKRSFKPFAMIFSMQYYPTRFNDFQAKRLAFLIGARYPTSSDLKKIHGEVLVGTSFDPYQFSHFPIEIRFLVTHIMGAGHSPIRWYLQWGMPLQIQNWYQSPNIQAGASVRLGLDFHL